MRSMAILAAAAMLSGGVGLSLAQDSGETPQDAADAAEAAEPETARPEDIDNSFRPSEEVEADTAVAFPTDI